MQIDRMAEQWNDHPKNHQIDHLGPLYETHQCQASQRGYNEIGQRLPITP